MKKPSSEGFFCCLHKGSGQRRALAEEDFGDQVVIDLVALQGAHQQFTAQQRQGQHHVRGHAFDLGDVVGFVNQRDDFGGVTGHFLGSQNGEHILCIVFTQGDDVFGLVGTGQFEGRS